MIARTEKETQELLEWWRGRYNDLTDSITAALDGRPVDTSDLRDYPLSAGAKKAIERVQARTAEVTRLRGALYDEYRGSFNDLGPTRQARWKSAEAYADALMADFDRAALRS